MSWTYCCYNPEIKLQSHLDISKLRGLFLQVWITGSANSFALRVVWSCKNSPHNHASIRENIFDWDRLFNLINISQEFDISEFEISRFDCNTFMYKRHERFKVKIVSTVLLIYFRHGRTKWRSWRKIWETQKAPGRRTRSNWPSLM